MRDYKFTYLVKVIIIAINAIISICFMLSAYSGIFNPINHSAIAVFGMTFPAFLIAQLLFALLWLFLKNWAYLIVNVVIIVAAWGPISTYSPLHFYNSMPTAQQEKTKFTVLTYNVFAFYDYLERESDKDFNHSLGHILDTDADIVCLQECYSFEQQHMFNSSIEQCDSLYSKYPYRATISRDIGLLSKYPILAADEIPLSRDSSNAAAVIFKVKIGQDTVTIGNVHLQSIGLTQSDKELYRKLTSAKGAPNNIDSINKVIKSFKSQLYSKLAEAMKLRASQAQKIREVLNKEHGTIILCGDFNDIPGSYAYREVKGDMTDAFAHCGLGPSITYHANRFFFRIDQVFYTGNIEAVNITRYKWDSSDHYPLFTTFVTKNINN